MVRLEEWLQLFMHAAKVFMHGVLNKMNTGIHAVYCTHLWNLELDSCLVGIWNLEQMEGNFNSAIHRKNITKIMTGVQVVTASKVLWCHFYLVWLVFECSIPICKPIFILFVSLH